MEGFLRFMRNGGGKSFQTMLPPAVFVAGMTLHSDKALRADTILLRYYLAMSLLLRYYIAQVQILYISGQAAQAWSRATSAYICLPHMNRACVHTPRRAVRYCVPCCNERQSYSSYTLSCLMLTLQCTGEPQSVVSLRFVSLIKQYMEQQWAASDDAVDIQQASDQDACWDMSVLQACLADQQKAWTTSHPQPSTPRNHCAVEPMGCGAPAPQQPSAVELLNQVLD